MKIDFKKQRITKEELKEAIDNNIVKVVEALPEDHYEKEHIAGAINIPPAKFKELAPKLLNKEDNIVVYCEDIGCLTSPQAARWLRERGYKKVLDYEAGKADWKNAGYPMES